MMVSVMYKINTVVHISLVYRIWSFHRTFFLSYTPTHPTLFFDKYEGKISTINSMKEPGMMLMMEKCKISTRLSMMEP